MAILGERMDARLLFVNIGWMVHYEGLTKTDRPVGGHGYLKKHGSGSEAWNFRRRGTKVYGYVPGYRDINIERIGATANGQSVSGVTVVWIARNPRNKRTYIVGWFSDATVYRERRKRKQMGAENDVVEYQVEARFGDATLLQVDARTFRIPTEKKPGNLGQNPVWFGRDDAFRDKVRSYIRTGGALRQQGGLPRQNDPALRKEIELAAVEHARRYFASVDGGRRTVRSVEKDGVGWDLEATSTDGETLKIEVKGLSGGNLVVELTPNEYAQMRSPHHRTDYVVYIVTRALQQDRKAHIFRYDSIKSSGKNFVWMADDGRRLVAKELVGARLSVR